MLQTFCSLNYKIVFVFRRDSKVSIFFTLKVGTTVTPITNRCNSGSFVVNMPFEPVYLYPQK